VAITGVAGPGGGTPEKPVGTVWIAVDGRGCTRFVRTFAGDRDSVRRQAVACALDALVTLLENAMNEEPARQVIETYGTVESGEATLFFRSRMVDGADASVILVHGLGEHSGRFERVAAALSASGCSTWALDLRGHGRTDGRRGVIHRFAELLDDLDAVRTVALERGPAVQFFLGHSMGGLVVLRYAQTRTTDRPAGTVAVAPFTGARMNVPGWKRALGVVADRALPGLALDSGVREVDVYRTDAERKRHEQDPLVHHRISARLWSEMQRNVDSVADGDVGGMPVLFQIPGDDRIVDSAATDALIRGRFPDADVRVYEEAYHDLYYDPVGNRAVEDAVEWIRLLRQAGPTN